MVCEDGDAAVATVVVLSSLFVFFSLSHCIRRRPSIAAGSHLSFGSLRPSDAFVARYSRQRLRRLSYPSSSTLLSSPRRRSGLNCVFFLSKSLLRNSVSRS